MMNITGRRLVIVPLLVGLLLWIFYDHVVGEATALIIGGALLLPSKRPITLRNVVISTIGCAVGFTLIRELIWKR